MHPSIAERLDKLTPLEREMYNALTKVLELAEAPYWTPSRRWDIAHIVSPVIRTVHYGLKEQR